MDNKGRKDDQGKTRWDLVDLSLLSGIADIREYGNKKYKENSWMEVEDAANRYFAALIRHLAASQHEELDKESGKPHLHHAQCNLYFLEWFRREGM